MAASPEKAFIIALRNPTNIINIKVSENPFFKSKLILAKYEFLKMKDNTNDKGKKESEKPTNETNPDNPP